MPCGLDEAQEEEAEGHLRNGHAEDGERLADALVEDGVHDVQRVFDIPHVLPETVVGGDVDEDGVEEDAYLLVVSSSRRRR